MNRIIVEKQNQKWKRDEQIIFIVLDARYLYI